MLSTASKPLIQTALLSIGSGLNFWVELIIHLFPGLLTPRSYLLKRLSHPHQAGIFRIGYDRETESLTHLQHCCVFAQHFADQLANATLSRHVDQPRHQQITEAAPLPVAAHFDGVFGLSVIRIRGEA